MGFEQFGIISFTGVTKTEQFVEFLKNNELRGTACKSCGAKFFPPRSDCDKCLANDMDWFSITGEGTLITYTKAMYAPAGFEKDVPYVLGVAEFSDGIKVFGRLDKSLPDDAIKAGMKVIVRILGLEDDRLSYELTAA
ncbi:MAG: Zn-ribbon domain-containing OB-fold protein [Desulfomonile tiedjei]|uniref:Zn-ribbon domain-containing OB-fold protein n=1 Tax=Desulfomonile tiedjei TaxID=2358 RepID=A0A9D6V5U2_9BACT|nr:Zn-ribbon domain-containing OB-fold protein [Desulfomonile tiedjei]